jgi:glycosyltransferase involved in cell wall biosynthesis
VRRLLPQIHEVIVVNDGSSDSSLEILESAADVTIHSLPVSKGYGEALKQGFQKAQGDLILFLDMDDTYDVRDLPKMYELLLRNKLDVVFGNRLTDANGMPAIRRFGNNFYHFCLRLLGFPYIQDPCTGMRIFRKNLAADFCKISQNDLSYSMALTLYILRSGLRYDEIKIVYHERIGESKLNPLTDGVRFFWTILAHRLSA